MKDPLYSLALVRVYISFCNLIASLMIALMTEPFEKTQREKQKRLFVLAWEPANGIYSEWGRDLHKRVLQFSTMGTFDAKFPSVCQSLSVSHFPSPLLLLFISISFVLSLSPNSLMSMFQLSSAFLKGSKKDLGWITRQKM